MYVFFLFTLLPRYRVSPLGGAHRVINGGIFQIEGRAQGGWPPQQHIQVGYFLSWTDQRLQ